MGSKPEIYLCTCDYLMCYNEVLTSQRNERLFDEFYYHSFYIWNNGQFMSLFLGEIFLNCMCFKHCCISGLSHHMNHTTIWNCLSVSPKLPSNHALLLVLNEGHKLMDEQVIATVTWLYFKVSVMVSDIFLSGRNILYFNRI